MQEFKEQVHERFNVAEGQILDIHKKIEELFVFLKKTQSTAEVMKEAIGKIQNINNVLKSNQRDLKNLASVVNDFETNGIKSKNKDSNTIDYDLLVKKLVKANRDIITSEIQFALKQKK